MNPSLFQTCASISYCNLGAPDCTESTERYCITWQYTVLVCTIYEISRCSRHSPQTGVWQLLDAATVPVYTYSARRSSARCSLKGRPVPHTPADIGWNRWRLILYRACPETWNLNAWDYIWTASSRRTLPTRSTGCFLLYIWAGIVQYHFRTSSMHRSAFHNLLV